MLPQTKFQLTYVELTQKHHRTGTCRADKQSRQSYYLFLLIFLLLHRLPLLHYILDQYHLEIKRMQHLNGQYSQVTIILNIYRHFSCKNWLYLFDTLVSLLHLQVPESMFPKRVKSYLHRTWVYEILFFVLKFKWFVCIKRLLKL